jgi:hypothetical protein
MILASQPELAMWLAVVNRYRLCHSRFYSAASGPQLDPSLPLAGLGFARLHPCVTGLWGETPSIWFCARPVGHSLVGINSLRS